MPSIEQYDWIFDYMLQFMESDRFDAAIMDFVDEKCEMFDNDDENKLIYTEIHREFREHVEALLATNLNAFGITVDVFFEACEKGRGGRDINQAVYDRMIAMDDFITFKKIMVKRNTELQLEAMENYEASRKVSLGMPLSKYEENENYESALKASMSGISNGGAKEVEAEDDKNLQNVMVASLADLEFRHKQEELEQLQLEAALALSMALEEERLALRNAEMKLENEIAEEAQQASPLAESKTSGYDDGEQNINQLIEEPSSKDVEAGVAPAAIPVKSAPYPKIDIESESTSSSSNNNKNSSRNGNSNSYDAGSKSTPPSRSALAPVTNNVTNDDDDLKRQAEEWEREMATKKKNKKKGGEEYSSIDVPEVKPLKMRGGGFKPLPKIDAGKGGEAAAALNEEMRRFKDKKKQAEIQLEANKEIAVKNRQQEEALRKQLSDAGVSTEDQRAKHMREQREKLLAAKRREREERVAEEESRRAKEGEDSLEAKAKKQLAELKAAGLIANDNDVKGEGNSSPEAALVEKRRSNMRMALARRMKMDLLESEEARLAKLQEDQFSDLDKKLGEVEQNRRESIKRDIQMNEERKARQAQFTRNMKASAAALQMDEI